ncbi:protein of unknown function [Pseudarcicella hirudinis]|uniref:Ferric-dicitrate binding protein FerR, regulates iron transport through sigma-19 n=1 Tax=Pseudarcicella hirudinis TaxID=1079859 RepID=A0A1I5TV05_9BACT|nr:FecR family protein [Pseudarcicella hirudinis]SFP86920.1 protein of unknown function [Pseudarcicella hirudinis]
MKYKYFNTNDFLGDDLLIRWALFNESDAFWQQFMEMNPDRKEFIDEAKQLILQIHLAENEANPSLNKEEIWARLKEQIDKPEESKTELLRERKVFRFPVWQWAASISVIIGLSTYFLFFRTDKKIDYQDLTSIAKDRYQLIEKINTGDSPLKVMLEDSSFIVLGKNSKISYPVHFQTGKREVYLSGEAFFEVAKNAQKPFYVYSNELITRVLGTSFTIKANESEDKITVDVKTGKVSVFKHNKINLIDPETRGLVLLPNQKALFDRANENLDRRLVEIPMPVKPLTARESKYFEDVPATHLLSTLENTYGIKIIYNEETLSKCIITTTLNNESLYEILDVVCNTIGATYKEVDAQIIIESNGCR